MFALVKGMHHGLYCTISVMTAHVDFLHLLHAGTMCLLGLVNSSVLCRAVLRESAGATERSPAGCRVEPPPARRRMGWVLYPALALPPFPQQKRHQPLLASCRRTPNKPPCHRCSTAVMRVMVRWAHCRRLSRVVKTTFACDCGKDDFNSRVVKTTFARGPYLQAGEREREVSKNIAWPLSPSPSNTPLQNSDKTKPDCPSFDPCCVYIPPFKTRTKQNLTVRVLTLVVFTYPPSKLGQTQT